MGSGWCRFCLVYISDLFIKSKPFGKLLLCWKCLRIPQSCLDLRVCAGARSWKTSAKKHPNALESCAESTLVEGLTCILRKFQGHAVDLWSRVWNADVLNKTNIDLHFRQTLLDYLILLFCCGWAIHPTPRFFKTITAHCCWIQNLQPVLLTEGYWKKLPAFWCYEP